MASNPIGQCCVVGFKHEGEPSGTIETVAGHEAYIARPTGSNKHDGVALVFITDVLGHKFKNAQLLADDYAANGYLTVVPDIMFGDPITEKRPESFNIQDWLVGKAPSGKAPHQPQLTFPIVEAVVRWLRTEQGAKKVGAFGYCYGANPTFHLIGKDKVGTPEGADAGYCAHPSFVSDEQVAAVRAPISISAAETDTIFPVEKRHETEAILAKIDATPKIPYQINLFSGVEHGFGVRGDLTQPQIRFGKEQAFIQAITWFDYWLLKQH